MTTLCVGCAPPESIALGTTLEPKRIPTRGPGLTTVCRVATVPSGEAALCKMEALR